MTRRKDVRASLIDLGLPRIVIDLFDGEPVDEELQHSCADPHYSFTKGTVLPADFLPMWENSTVVTGFDRSDQLFKKISLELPSAHEILGPKLRNVVADLLLFALEMDEGDDRTARRIANLFNYAGIDQLIEAQKVAHRASMEYTAWAEWRGRTILMEPPS